MQSSDDREQVLSEAREWIAHAEADGEVLNARRLLRLVQALESESARAERWQAEAERLQGKLRTPMQMSPMMGPPAMGGSGPLQPATASMHSAGVFGSAASAGVPGGIAPSAFASPGLGSGSAASNSPMTISGAPCGIGPVAASPVPIPSGSILTGPRPVSPGPLVEPPQPPQPPHRADGAAGDRQE